MNTDERRSLAIFVPGGIPQGRGLCSVNKAGDLYINGTNPSVRLFLKQFLEL